MSKRLVILLALAALLLSFAAPVSAATTPPVQITLGGSGATPWNIGNIAPGQSGTKVITVQNTGLYTGNLTLWISNIANTDGTPARFQTQGTGDLGQFLTFSVTSSRISGNITMPTRLGNFPSSASDSHYLKVFSLRSAELITMTWQWNLPPNVGNVVQGDSLTFDINYGLEQSDTLPPQGTTTVPPTSTTGITSTATDAPPSTTPTGVTTTAPVTVISTPAATTAPTTLTSTPPTSVPGAPTTGTSITNPVITSPETTTPAIESSAYLDLALYLDNTGRATEPLTIVSGDGVGTIFIPAGTLLLDAEGNRLIGITLYTYADPANPVSLTIMAMPSDATFSPPITLIFHYDTSQVNADEAQDLKVYMQLSDGSWQAMPGGVIDAQAGTVTVEISHLGVYAVRLPGTETASGTSWWLIGGIGLTAVLILGFSAVLMARRHSHSSPV